MVIAGCPRTLCTRVQDYHGFLGPPSQRRPAHIADSSCADGVAPPARELQRGPSVAAAPVNCPCCYAAAAGASARACGSQLSRGCRPFGECHVEAYALNGRRPANSGWGTSRSFGQRPQIPVADQWMVWRGSTGPVGAAL